MRAGSAAQPPAMTQSSFLDAAPTLFQVSTINRDARAHRSAAKPTRAPALPSPIPAVLTAAASAAGGAGGNFVVFLGLASFLLAITSSRRRFRLAPELRWTPAYVAVSDPPG
jgi:hypothetical protein